jgi:hypothetical protein
MDSGRRAQLFGEVNDRIFELLNTVEPNLPGEFLCECGSECGRRVELLPAAFASLRRSDRSVRSADCRRRIFRRREAMPERLPALG